LRSWKGRASVLLLPDVHEVTLSMPPVKAMGAVPKLDDRRVAGLAVAVERQRVDQERPHPW